MAIPDGVTRARGLRVHFALSVVVVVACALAFAGVGGAALTPKQYRARAGAICERSTNRVTDLLAALGLPHPSRAAMIAYLKGNQRVTEDELRALRALDPPAAFRALHLKILALMKRIIAVTPPVIAKIKAGADPMKALRASNKNYAPFDDAITAAWRKLDIPNCYD
jgi:hypothetical protein